jgi:transposase
MLDKLTRHTVQALLGAGLAHLEIAQHCHLSESSVQRIGKEEPVTDVDDNAEVRRRGIGRPSKTAALRDLVRKLLDDEPSLMSLEILRRSREKGYTGQKSALYALVSELRPKGVALEMRFDGLPGEFSQHDFGEVIVRYLDGSSERVHFFASRMKYSRATQVSIVPNQQAETLVRSLLDHFVAFGGVPLMAVFDRPKTVALKWSEDGKVTEWNPTFAQAALDIGFGAEVCWPHAPRQKGSVENLVKWVKGSFFKQRRFQDRADLQQQLAEWLHEVNEVRPSRATDVVPAVRLAEERKRLRPPRVNADELALRIATSVGPTGYVLYDRQPYSMPPLAAGLPATVYLHRNRVRIVAGRYQAIHERRFGKPLQPATLPEHRSSQLAAIHGKRGQRYLKRQHLLDTGEAAAAFLTELTFRDPNGWIREVDRLHVLLQHHGPQAMDRAFRVSIDVARYEVDYVQRCLGPYQLSLLKTTEAA